MKRNILVTGATGNIGSLIVPQLLESGASVRVLVRDPQKAMKLRDEGAEVYKGDLSDQDALDAAASGVDAIMAITPAGPEAVKQGDGLIKAARAAGNPHYVRLSAIGASSDTPTDNGKLHFKSDQALINSGLPYTILRPHYFMQNLFMAADSIRSEGKFYLGMGQGSLGLIDVRDIADSCAAILLSDDHKGQIYNPTGSDSVTFTEIASIISKGLGKKVDYVPIPVEEVGQAILDAGWGEWGAKVMVDYSKAYSEGWGDYTNGDVETITGKPARSFQQFFDDVFILKIQHKVPGSVP